METTLQIIWWIGLLGALLLTVVILKEVALLHKALRDIWQLARWIRTASRGIAGNVEGTEALERMAETAVLLPPAVLSLADAAERIEEVVSGLARGGPVRKEREE